MSQSRTIAAAAGQQQERLRQAEQALSNGREAARQWRAQTPQLADTAIAGLTRWVQRLQQMRQSLRTLYETLREERRAVHRMARQVLWSWPIIRLRLLTLFQWLHLHWLTLLLLTINSVLVAWLIPRWPEATASVAFLVRAIAEGTAP